MTGLVSLALLHNAATLASGDVFRMNSCRTSQNSPSTHLGEQHLSAAPTPLGWHHTHGVGRSEKTRVEEEKAPVSETQEKNKALVRRFLEAQDKGDLEAVKEMMAPDFVDHSALAGQAPNREDYIRDLTEDQAAFSNFSYIIEDQAAEGDKVISRCTISAIHDREEVLGFAPTGREIETTYISIHRIVGGKIAEEWTEGGGMLELTQERLEQEIRERERVEQELRVARSIQQASLPKQVPELEGWEISPHYRPAREVGGDFYDFLELANGHLGLVVGDATGKGVPAALVMASARSMLRAVAQASESPGEVLRRANDPLATDIPPNM